MSPTIVSPKKLIEVALPLDAINAAAAREKSIRQGHPSSLHLWWARRPLVAARAVIFAQTINDPSWKWDRDNPGKTPPAHLKASWAAGRKRLFAIIERLISWEEGTSEEILEEARAEIRKSWRESCDANKDHPQANELFDPDKVPPFHDPFAGGGAIPLEAQRLGFEAHASDLNPVAVLVTKAMIELPPRFAGRAPVCGALNGDGINEKGLLGPQSDDRWSGLRGLAQDVQHYGRWMRCEAEKRIGSFYPKVAVTKEMAAVRPDLAPLVGQPLTVIAWLWARTVNSPSPAFSHVPVPLASSFVLSKSTGKQAYVEPVVQGDRYSFTVKLGRPTDEAAAGTKAVGRGASFRCLLSGSVIGAEYIRSEAQAGRMGQRLLAIAAEGARGRIYLPAMADAERIATKAEPPWKPDVEFLQQALGFRVGNYGMTKWSDLFTSRQLLALTTFSDLIGEAAARLREDALSSGTADDGARLKDGGRGPNAYAEAVSVYLSFALDKMADLGNSLVRWEPVAQCPRQLFGRQAIPMVWDFAEANPFSDSSGGWTTFVDGLSRALAKAFSETRTWFTGHSVQADAQTQTISMGKIVSTDPPYYDNIGYADLSDFFYVWLRRSLRAVYPDLLATIAVPKAEELVATPFRHGGREQAEEFFLRGMTSAMQRVVAQARPDVPVTIYYAFKQSDTNEAAGTSSTGWVTFLAAMHEAGLQLTGTWPLRTENASRMRGQRSNALASSILLVCRKRPSDAPSTSRRQFIRELNQFLPEALDAMTRGSTDDHSPVAPVDLSQAIIGPGMAVFSKYSAVLEADGSPMSVKTALQLINRFLAEDDFDADTQFCLRWFEQHHWDVGPFGEADVLARAKGTSVEGVRAGGVVSAAGGKVRLIRPADYPADWSVAEDDRLPVWEALHQLIRALRTEGESGAGAILAAVSSRAEAVRQLAYRLYTLCERAGLAEDARAYNELVTSWNALESAAAASGVVGQRTMFD